MESASTYRERAGVFVSVFLILAWAVYGFAMPFLVKLMGAPVPIDQDWKAAMNVLAAGAFAYLIGKQTNSGPTVTASLGNDAGSASATVTGAADKKPGV